MAEISVPLNEGTLRAQLGEVFERLPREDRSEYPSMLEAIRQPGDVAVIARPEGEVWRVTVVTADWVGILSVIAGMFSARKIDVVSGDVLTLRFRPPAEVLFRAGRSSPHVRRRKLRLPGPPTKKILDVFRVRPPQKVDASFWEQFREELASLVKLLAEGNPQAARESVIDRVSKASSSASPSDQPLFPVSVEIDNDSSPSHTRLRIRSPDTPGFLFEFANALSLLGIDVERVEIRTEEAEARDTFWMRDAAGRKIVDEDRLQELRIAAALIKQFTHLLPRSPNPAQALRQFTAFTRQMVARPDWTSELESLESGAVLVTLADLMGVSEFLWEDFLRMQHANLYPVLREVPLLDRAHSKAELAAQLDRELEERPAGSDAGACLNRFKDREMFRIDLRHITRRIGFLEFSYELSDLAEAVISKAAELSVREVAQRAGAPLKADGKACAWCVCALGKCGGREMGFASDVELIFVYEAEGAKQGPRSMPNAEFFPECVRNLSTMLTSRRDGIFEIDLALRPYGSAGALAGSLDAFRRYFSETGDAQQFERIALVKLRPVAGDTALGDEVGKLRDAFVYSGNPLDYEEILHLRQRQAAELVSTGEVNAKFSLGGLVDVEYFVQTRQIEAGPGRESVRVPNTWEAIESLGQVGSLKAEQAEELRETYGFLRRLIDALRVVRGHARDLTLPPPDSREFAYLARRLLYDSVAKFTAELARHRDNARNLWSEAGVSSRER